MTGLTRRDTAVVERVGWVPFACALVALVVVALAGITWNGSHYFGRNAAAAARDTGSVPVSAADAARALGNMGPMPYPGGPSTAAASGSAPTGGSTGNAAPTGPAAAPGAGTAVAAAQVAPNRIEIPRLKTTARVVPVATTPNGALDIPLDPLLVGWWRDGARPGATTGTAILAGHVNYSGVSGSLAGIGRLAPGDLVDVYGTHNAGGRAEIAFRVTGVRTYHKSTLPYASIFDQHSTGRIVLVTCGGPFDAFTGNYLDNVVVFAVPA